MLDYVQTVVPGTKQRFRANEIVIIERKDLPKHVVWNKPFLLDGNWFVPFQSSIDDLNTVFLAVYLFASPEEKEDVTTGSRMGKDDCP